MPNGGDWVVSQGKLRKWRKIIRGEKCIERTKEVDDDDDAEGE